MFSRKLCKFSRHLLIITRNINLNSEIFSTHPHKRSLIRNIFFRRFFYLSKTGRKQLSILTAHDFNFIMKFLTWESLTKVVLYIGYAGFISSRGYFRAVVFGRYCSTAESQVFQCTFRFFNCFPFFLSVVRIFFEFCAIILFIFIF